MKYVYENEQINESRQEVESNCSGIIFINTGTLTAFINNMPLVAGSSLALGTSDQSIDRTKYSINFGGNTGGAINIWRKKYTL
jgi:Na+/H+ antiporter NhaD/arsenite permease-like protein